MEPRIRPADVRGAERRVVGIHAQLREAGASRLDVEVLDLSVSGFRVESIYGIAIGARVFLTIPTFAPLEATVVWRHRTGYGCAFDHPLHVAVWDLICARYPGL